MDFESIAIDAQPPDTTETYENGLLHLAGFLALLAEKSPELAEVVEAWPDLAEPVRAGISAMVRSAKGDGR